MASSMTAEDKGAYGEQDSECKASPKNIQQAITSTYYSKGDIPSFLRTLPIQRVCPLSYFTRVSPLLIENRVQTICCLLLYI
jgi:hypothetical protein